MHSDDKRVVLELAGFDETSQSALARSLYAQLQER